MDIKAKEGMNAQNENMHPVKGFSLTLPDEFQAGFEMGDTIVLPKVMGTVFEQKFGEKGRAQYMVVEVRHANGSKEAINWFPASMLKSIFPVEVENGMVTKTLRPIHHVGSAVDMMKACRGRGAENGTTDLQLAVNGFLGHEILVEKVDIVPTEKWKNGVRTGEPKDTRVYTYTFVKKGGK